MSSRNRIYNFAEEIKRKVAFDELFREMYPGLYQQHGNSKGPCHDDATPSFQVEKDHGYCHSCGKRFSVIDLWMLKHGCDFRTAVDQMAAHYGINGHTTGNDAVEKRIVQTYSYLNEEGKKLYETVRHDPKDFRQRRPDPDKPGEWIWNLEGVRRVLYRLLQVLQADTVWICEGEKDDDNLSALGFCATTNCQGAKKWPGQADKWKIHEPLRGKTVLIIPDNDSPGRAHAQQIARSLHGFAERVKVLDLKSIWPEIPAKGDVSDLISVFGREKAKGLLLKLAETAPEWEPSTESKKKLQDEAEGAEDVHLSDLGNARRLAMLYGDRIRYCPSLGWLFYDGKRWVTDETSQLQRYAKDVVRALYGEAESEPDEKRRKALGSFALKCEAAHKINSMLALLPSEAGISVSHEIFDTNPWILNVDNGLVNLRTGQLQDHRPEDYCTKLSPTTFDPKALSPRWERFILEIMLANGEMAAFLRRLTGYALTGDTSEQIWVYLWGKGSNGKSTFLAVLRRILGQYAVNTPAETFLHTSGDRIRNDLARLKGARLVTASEPSGERFDVGTLKAFTGGDTISARFMRREYFDYRPTGKLFFSANKRLEVRDQTLGFWRRVIIIPFRAEFPKNNRLEEELMAEAPAILAWAIRGCLEWQATGLQIPESVRLAVEDYRSATDFLDDFLKEHCASGEGMSVTVKRLYEEYSGYCEERKIRKPLSAQKFNEDLLSRPGIGRAREGKERIHIWLGIGLKVDPAGRKSCATCDLEGEPCQGIVGQGQRDAARCNYYRPYH